MRRKPNPIAKDLRTSGLYRMRVVELKTRYTRKSKHPLTSAEKYSKVGGAAGEIY